MDDAKRIRIMRTFDVKAFMATPECASLTGGFNLRGEYHGPETIALAAIHKGRVGQPNIFTKAERDESIMWLLRNGYRAEGPNRAARRAEAKRRGLI